MIAVAGGLERKWDTSENTASYIIIAKKEVFKKFPER